MNSIVCSKFNNHQDAGLFKDKFNYPDGYHGQELNEPYIFVPETDRQTIRSNRKSVKNYLSQFAKEVAAGNSERAKQYLRTYPSGQRYLWIFPDEEMVLISLVVLLPVGPRTVMWLGRGIEFCDGQGNLLQHAELCVRWSIETSVGTSTHPLNCK